MVVQQVYFTVKPSSVKQFIEHTKENVLCSNREPGVKRFEFLKDKNSDNRFVLFEIFNSPDDQNDHRETPHYQRWKEKIADLLEVPYTRTVFEDMTVF